jgi:AcrR family transcriptional regulator
METTKDALIDRYIEAVADRETIVTRQIEAIERQLPGEQITEDGKSELREKLIGIMGESIEEVARPCLEDVSTETLEAAAEFFESEAGQEITAIQPEVMARLQEHMQEVLGGHAREIEAIIQQHTFPAN